MHLHDDDLIAAAFDSEELGAISAAHLASCDDCQARLRLWRELSQDMAVGRASTPSEAILARYETLFSDVTGGPAGPWQRLGALIATLTWDGRGQTAGAGIRSAGPATYRLLYTAEPYELELMVVASGGQRVIEGAWLEGEGTEEPAPVLVELIALGAQDDPVTVATGEHGRFRLDAIMPGAYRMVITPTMGRQFTIERMDV